MKDGMKMYNYVIKDYIIKDYNAYLISNLIGKRFEEQNLTEC